MAPTPLRNDPRWRRLPALGATLLPVLLLAGWLVASAVAQEAGDEEGTPLPEPRLIGPRRDPGRKEALSRYGGDGRTEAAVLAGLDWLARHRDEDGGWDADGFPRRCAQGGPACSGIGKGQHGEEAPCPFDAAITGLVALAFLGHGHAPDPEGDDRARLVEESLRTLEGARDPWSLAISTEAFAEAEAMERKGRWLEATRAGVERLLDRRGTDGAWGYAAGFRPGADVPYTAFAIQALVAARDVGIDLPGDLAAGVEGFLASLEEDSGKLAYLKDGRRYGYTPTAVNGHIAAAVRELLEVGTGSPRHRAHLALLSREKPAWKIAFKELEVKGRGKVRVQIGNLSLYQWWYGTIAAFQAGGNTWSGWFGAAKGALLPHQGKDG